MAVHALQVAMNELEDRPQIPQLQLVGLGSPTKSVRSAERAKLIADVQGYADSAAARIKRKASMRQELAEEYRKFSAAAAPAHLAEAADGLTQLIEAVQGHIKESNQKLLESRKLLEGKLRGIASSHPMEARFVRTQLDKFFGAATQEQNDFVDYYYFVIALRADLDPDSRGGPQFDDLKELDAYIRAQLKT